MVSTASAAAQANELEKKRKQTLEKAKANHLSRQLQMRLQYARLKVEHGWHRQNLNEVENLYFHHSHQRGPRSFPSSTLVSTQTDNSTTLTPASKYSDPSYKTWLQSISRSTTLEISPDNTSQGNSAAGNPHPVPSASSVPSSQTPGESQGTLMSVPTPPGSAEISTFQPLEDRTTVTETLVAGSQSHSSAQHNQSENPPPTYANVATAPIASTSTANFPIPTTPQQSHLSTSLVFTSGTTSYMPSILTSTPTLPMSHKPVLGHKNSSSSTTKDVFASNTASLTYDSFWSGLQSKSYSTLKNTGGTSSGTEVVTTTGSSGKLAGSFSNGQTSTSPPASDTISVPFISLQNPISTSTSALTPSPPLQPASSHPQPLATSIQPASTSLPALIAPSFLAPMPASMPLPMPVPLTDQQIPPQTQIQMPTRYFGDNLVPWGFNPAQPPETQGFPYNLIPPSLLANPAFLANLSATYAQTFGAIGSPDHPPSVGNAEGNDAQATPAAAPPPISPIVSPVVSAFVGQQGS